MWVWKVDDEVGTYCLLLSNPWELLLRYAYTAMLCQQTWFGFERSLTDVRVLLMVKLKVATLIHIWVDWLWAPGESSVVLGYPGVPM